MDVAVEIHCGRCGSANYSLPGGTAAEAPILCNDCGERLGTVAELIADLVQHSADHSAEALRRNLDRLGEEPADEAA